MPPAVCSVRMSSRTTINGWLLDDDRVDPGSGHALPCSHETLPDCQGVARLLARLPSAQSAWALRRSLAPLLELKHPALLPTLDIFAEEEQLFLVSGPPLGASLTGTADDITPAALGAQLAGGLAALHAVGLFHGAIGPDRVFVDAGRAVLGGLGDGIIGAQTSPYAAPELAEDGPGAAADVYALGALLRERRSGTNVTPGSHDTLAGVLDRMTSSAPEARPAAAEVATLLTRLSSTAPPTGAPRVERYRRLKELGRGGMGVVFLAEDTLLDRRVALKAVLVHGSGEARFRREARALAALDHPGVVKVLDFGYEDGRPFLAMEFIEGVGLDDWLLETPMPPLAEVVRLSVALADALAHVHDRGLIHRDLKPSNVLLRGGLDPVLLDFGLVTEGSERSQQLTRTGQAIGTPAYMSPEQAAGSAELGPAADIYSLGAVLFELATGEPPFSGETPLSVLHKVLETSPPPPGSLRPGLPPGLDRICLKAMARAPADRYPTAAALADDLRALEAGDAVEAERGALGRRIRAAKHASRRELAAGLGALALLLLTFAAAALVGQVSERRDEAAREQAAADQLAVLRARAGELPPERRADAEALLLAFIEEPAITETRALHEAWWWWAGEQREAERTLTALAHAWAAAREPADALRALTALAASFDEVDNPSGFAITLDRLQSEHPDAWASDPVVAGLREREAIGRRSFGALTPRADDPWADALTALASAREYPEYAAVRAVTQTPDGLLIEQRSGEFVLVAEDEALTLLRALPLADDAPTPGAESALLVSRSQRLLALEEGRLLTVPLPPGLPTQHTRAVGPFDAARPGGGPLYYLTIANHRRLLSLTPGEGGWALGEPHAATNLLNSRMSDSAAVDLDGDGEEELAVVTAEWGSYDARVYKHGEDGLALTARLRIGTGQSLATPRGPGGRRLLAVNTHGEGHGFDEANSTTRSWSLHLLRLNGGALEQVDQRDFPRRHKGYAGLTRLLAGDLDGDGLDEVLSYKCDQPFYREEPDGRCVLEIHALTAGRQLLRLYDIQVLAAVQLDDDPADELLVRVAGSPSLYAVGVGGESLPIRAAAPGPAPAPAPTGSDPTFAERWDRAEALVAAGLPAAASLQLERLAKRTPDAQHAAEALLRAAGLAREEGAWERCGALHEAARALPGVRLTDAGGVDCLMRTGSYEAAASEASALLATGALSSADGARLSGLVAALAPALEIDRLDLTGPLHPSWRVLDAAGLSHRPLDGGLHVRSASDSHPLARLPLLRTGDGAFGLDVSMLMTRIEWSAGLAVSLETPSGERIFTVRHRGQGGGGTIRQKSQCETSAGRKNQHGVPVAPDRATTVVLRGLVSPSDGTITCGTDIDGELLLTASWDIAPDERGARYTLVLEGDGFPGDGFAASAILEQITLRGLAVESPPDGATLDASALMVSGRASEALAATPGLSGAALWLALDASGRRDEADAALASVPTPEMMTLLRFFPERVIPSLRAKGGDDLWLLIAQAWVGPMSAHPSDRAARQPLLLTLGGLEAVEPADAEEAEAVIALLLISAEAHREVQRREQAEVAARRAEALSLAHGLGGAASARLTLARLAAESGDRAIAAELAAAAVAASETPELIEDRIAFDPLLSALPR